LTAASIWLALAAPVIELSNVASMVTAQAGPHSSANARAEAPYKIALFMIIPLLLKIEETLNRGEAICKMKTPHCGGCQLDFMVNDHG
jgi:hypothetical protein